tara:strand:- start:12524 stop:13618 length:1095 start_codon:yes stop_codon:yes gene_type:complete
MTIWVIKIGTSILRDRNNMSTEEIIDAYCKSISQCMNEGNKVVLVSSGAVGIGCQKLDLIHRPKEITSLQVCAAVGQVELMSIYEDKMSKYGIKTAQILLTRKDLSTRSCYKNASMTIKKIMEWGILAIVNENDTVSNEELLHGDNDTLSALVSSAISAHQLVLLTDIDRLYSEDPKTNINAEPISDVRNKNELLSMKDSSINSLTNTWGTGGIATKLSAAQIATESGTVVQLADGRNPESLASIFKGSRGGTVFHPNPKPMTNKKSWLSYAIVPLGAITLDEGACKAIKDKGASLLLVGIKKVSGNFGSNQPVQILNNFGDEIAKGISSLSSDKIKASIQNSNSNNRSIVVVHRDVLVITSDK